MRIEFEENSKLTEQQYKQYLSDYFEFDTGAEDIYIVSVSFLVGRFTNNYHYYFLALSIVFAFFQIKCLGYFVRQKNFNNSWICILLACLFLWINIYNINGARFWTACWMGIYCVFKVFYDKKYIFFLLACSLFLVHAAFIIFPLVMILTLCLKFWKKPLLILFCLSCTLSFASDNLDLQFLDEFMPYSVFRKIQFYSDSQYIIKQSSGTGLFWVDLMFKSLANIYLNIMILLVIIYEQRIREERCRGVVLFMIVLAIISNFGKIIPAFGGRFFTVDYALISYSFLAVFGDRKFRKLIYFFPFVWFMKLFYLYKDVVYVQDFWFVLSPVISFIRYLIV